MEKIVILTGNIETDDYFIKCLKMLFPECEIDVRQKKAKDMKGQPSSIKTTTVGNFDDQPA